MANSIVKTVFEEFYPDEPSKLSRLDQLLLTHFGHDESLYIREAYNLAGYAMTGKTIDYVISLLDETRFGWSAPCFAKIAKLQLEHDHYMTTPYDSNTDGVVQCKNCKSMKTVSKAVQTRGSDEAMTVFSWCRDCNSTTKT